MRVGLSLAALLLLLAAPLASAEFGRESADGYPVGADGRVQYPPVAPVTYECFTPDCAVVQDTYAAVAPLNKVGPLTVYPYYPLLTLELQRLADAYPDLVRLTSAGKSTAGLDLWMLEFANFADLEAGTAIPLEDREVLYLDGGTHSNEYSGVYFNTEWAQFLLEEYETNETAKWILDNRHVYMIPLVNPDGSNVFGRLNAKTVNINRNYPATWGAIEENPVLNNPGPEPASEVETQVVISVLDAIQPDYVNSIHCCALLFLHPWGAEEVPPALDLQMYTKICDETFAGELRDRCGPIWSTIYPASGTTADEGYNRTGASSWTFEMHGNAKVGAWGEPVVERSARELEADSWNAVMHAMLNVEKYGAHPEIVAMAGDDATLQVVIENTGYGNLTKGTLTVGATVLDLPPLAPGERATLDVAGSFSAGTLPTRLDYVKRAMLEPKGHSALAVPLVAEGDRLVAVLPDAGGDLVVPASVPAAVPGLGALGLVAALGAVAVLARRW